MDKPCQYCGRPIPRMIVLKRCVSQHSSSQYCSISCLCLGNPFLPKFIFLMGMMNMLIAFILGVDSGLVALVLVIVGVVSVWFGLGYNLRYLTLKTIEERIIQVLLSVSPDTPITLSPIVDFARQIHARREDVEYVIEVMERKGTIIRTPSGFILN